MYWSKILQPIQAQVLIDVVLQIYVIHSWRGLWPQTTCVANLLIGLSSTQLSVTAIFDWITMRCNWAFLFLCCYAQETIIHHWILNLMSVPSWTIWAAITFSFFNFFYFVIITPLMDYLLGRIPAQFEVTIVWTPVPPCTVLAQPSQSCFMCPFIYYKREMFSTSEAEHL